MDGPGAPGPHPDHGGDTPRVNYNHVVRIARRLQAAGRHNRTRLAGVCGINYSTCTRCLDWMSERGYVTIDKHVELTAEGLSLVKMLV